MQRSHPRSLVLPQHTIVLQMLRIELKTEPQGDPCSRCEDWTASTLAIRSRLIAASPTRFSSRPSSSVSKGCTRDVRAAPRSRSSPIRYAVAVQMENGAHDLGLCRVNLFPVSTDRRISVGIPPRLIVHWHRAVTVGPASSTESLNEPSKHPAPNLLAEVLTIFTLAPDREVGQWCVPPTWSDSNASLCWETQQRRPWHGTG